ncbi:MAG: DinB family protein [Armatimonadota bacterium]|nr:DinB family protein [Armatimonadota bacterium]
MTVKDLVLDHLTYTFERDAWQPSLSHAVEGLTAAQAAWKPSPERHSIWQIVRHVILWKQGVLDAWSGKVPDYKEFERMDWQEVTGDDAAWQADVRKLRNVSLRLKRRVQAATSAAMGKKIPTYTTVPDQVLATRLTRMATHDSYHAGQIRYVRALQGV